MPESITTLFDHTASLHGLAPEGLGSYGDGNTVSAWGSDGPPNADSDYCTFLSDAEREYVNLPQYFDNGGTNQTVGNAVLDGPEYRHECGGPRAIGSHRPTQSSIPR